MRLLEYSLILTIFARIGIAKVSKLFLRQKFILRRTMQKKKKGEKWLELTHCCFQWHVLGSASRLLPILLWRWVQDVASKYLHLSATVQGVLKLSLHLLSNLYANKIEATQEMYLFFKKLDKLDDAVIPNFVQINYVNSNNRAS